MRHFRLLAIKNGIPKEIEYASCGNAFSYEKYKKLKTKKEDSSTYKRLKREGLNDMEIYKKSFQCKYNKKKGLAKLDCHCEKKIFDKLDVIRLLAKNMKDDKKCFKKVCKRYGLPFALSFIFAFTLGIIIVLDGCGIKCLLSATNGADSYFYVGYSILLIILPIIIFLVISYITIKIKKYYRLVEGKVEGKTIAKYITCYYDDTFNSR
ncbi:hypothetical protein PVBG_05571 [Plasmodium vivax Brazil I]|uniref:Variable surface protein n=1 Tax=Plasmodium vivax (strain Brazil I) TaxID=1033975 RepID=A0A0J9SZX6_PLAV1|nr:hypothetical protein PVBG_05571 [Plasmodium vivax Brazil I]